MRIWKRNCTLLKKRATDCNRIEMFDVGHFQPNQNAIYFECQRRGRQRERDTLQFFGSQILSWFIVSSPALKWGFFEKVSKPLQRALKMIYIQHRLCRTHWLTHRDTHGRQPSTSTTLYFSQITQTNSDFYFNYHFSAWLPVIQLRIDIQMTNFWHKEHKATRCICSSWILVMMNLLISSVIMSYNVIWYLITFKASERRSSSFFSSSYDLMEIFTSRNHTFHFYLINIRYLCMGTHVCVCSWSVECARFSQSIHYENNSVIFS